MGRCALPTRLLLLALATFLPVHAELITLDDFRDRMLRTYPSPQDAFAALDATAEDLDAALDDRPLDISEFTRGTQTFQPPLSPEQARYAFQSLDADHDGSLTSAEFVLGLSKAHFGEQAPSAPSTTPVADPAAKPTAPVEEPTAKPAAPSVNITIGELERRIEDELPDPTIVRSHPQDAFKLLDMNNDGFSELAEFMGATARFKTPLSQEEASGVFSKLDTNNDGRVKAEEFYQAMGLEPSTPVDNGPITFSEYRERLQGVQHQVGVMMQISGIDLDRLPEAAKNDVVRILVLGLADAAGVDTKAVKDLTGKPASVSLSSLAVEGQSDAGPAARLARLRRLASRQALVVEAIIELREGQSANSDDVLAVMSTQDRKDRFADDLTSVPGIGDVTDGSIEPAGIHISALGKGSGMLLVVDSNHDGSVEPDEFRTAGNDVLHPALTAEQADQVFKGLDANYDGQLNYKELAGDGMGSFAPPGQVATVSPTPAVAKPETSTELAAKTGPPTTMTMLAFRESMNAKFSSPEAAFAAIESNPSDLPAFTRVVKTFEPPLNEAQAKYVFNGLDADNDNLLFKTEFLDVLRFGRFNPSIQNLEKMTTTEEEMLPASKGEGMSAVAELPLPVGLGYLLLVGYLLRTVFMGLRLPGMIGLVVSGMSLSYFMPGELLQAQDELQELVFFLVLFTAGFDLSLADLRPYSILMAILPATCELAAITAYGVVVLGYSLVQSLAMGTSLFAVSGGIVAPKLAEFGRNFPSHPMPRLVATWLSVETSFALTVFGILVGLTSPMNQPAEGTSSMRLLLLSNFARFAATVCVGTFLGYVTGKIIPQRRRVQLLGRRVFTGAPVESFIIITAICLLAFGTGATGEDGQPLARMGFSSQALFQPEVLVMTIGAFFAFAAEAHELEGVGHALGGVWVFGQMILFSLIGSTIDTSERELFAKLSHVFTMMAIGLALRLAGIFVSMLLALKIRPCSCQACVQANSGTLCTDVMFCFLCTLPRSTIQGCLGSMYISHKVLAGTANAMPVQLFIADAARLYMIILAGLGSLALELCGQSLLRSSSLRGSRCENSVDKEAQLQLEGWTVRQRALTGGFGTQRKFFRLGLVSEDGVLFEDMEMPIFPVKDAVQMLAQAYHVDPSAFSDMMMKTTGRASLEDGGSQRAGSTAGGSVRSLPQHAQNEQASHLLTEKPTMGPSRTKVSRITNIESAPPMSLLEADGSLGAGMDPKADHKSSEGEHFLANLVRL